MLSEAIRRGREIVAAGGPMALTMRGLARELGITASALIYYFHNRAGLRAAIANAVVEEMRPFCVFRSGGERAAKVLREKAEDWVNFAAANPNLYRIAFGEGWRGGWCSTMARGQTVHSVDRVAHVGQQSGYVRPGKTKDHGWFLFAAMHGLAHTAADCGTRQLAVGPFIDRFVASVALNRTD